MRKKLMTVLVSMTMALAMFAGCGDKSTDNNVNQQQNQTEPTATPIEVPTSTPAAEPTAEPTVAPTATSAPTVTPTSTPTPEPTQAPVVDENAAFSNSKTFAEPQNWWYSYAVSVEELIGDVAPETVDYIEFTGTAVFVLQWRNTTGDSQDNMGTEYYDPYIYQPMGQNNYVAQNIDFSAANEDGTTGYLFNICFSQDKAIDCMVSWNVYTKEVEPVVEPTEAPTPEPTEAPEPTVDTSTYHTDSLTFSDSAWWTMKPLTAEQLFGAVPVEDVTYVKFTSSTAFALGYLNTTGDGVLDQYNNNVYWTQLQGATEYVVTIDRIDLNDLNVQIALSKGDGVDYTITWEAFTEEINNVGDDDTEVTDSAAAYTNSKTFSEPQSWWYSYTVSVEELLGGVAVEEVDYIKFSGTSVFVLQWKNTTGDSQDNVGTEYYNPYIYQPMNQDNYIAKNIDFGEEYMFNICFSTPDPINCTVTWEVYTK